jgi:hypothetical protein
MGNQEPVALSLAERLERRRLTRWVHATGETPRASGYVIDQDCAEAAAELRRLHELNQELLESLKDAADAIEHWGAYAPDYFKTKHDLQADIDRARDIIAKAEGKV